MQKLTTLLIVVAIGLGVMLLVAVFGGLLVLLAYGVGLLVNLVLHLDPFQATLLSLVSMIGVGLWVMRLLSTFISLPTDLLTIEDSDELEDEPELPAQHVAPPPDHPGIPRWRQPRKSADFSDTQPNDLCPCGSGRKYKNCHGAKPGKG